MTKILKKIALIYHRVSTHEQSKKISPEFQKNQCIEYAIREGYEVDLTRDIYCDDTSAFVGKGDKRDGFKSMTKRWETDPRVSAVIIYDMSRLHRDMRGFINYEYDMQQKDVELISVSEPSVRDKSPSAKLPRGVIALVNEYTSALYAEKIKKNMAFKASSGVYPGKAPYGYKNVREEGNGKTKAWIEVDQEEAPWVTQAFSEYATGKPHLEA